MKRALLARDVERVLSALAGRAGAVVLTGPGGESVWRFGDARLAVEAVEITTAAGPLRLSVPPASADQARLLVPALEQLAAQREAIDDLAATARRLWAEQGLIFSAGEVLRHGCREEEIYGWLVDRLAAVPARRTTVARWDGIALAAVAGSPPPPRPPSRTLPGEAESQVLDSGQPLSWTVPAGGGGGTVCGGELPANDHCLIASLRCAERVQGLVALERSREERAFTAEEVKLAQLLSDVASVALANRELVREAEHTARLLRELELAAEIQQRLLPPVHASYGALEVEARCLPVAWIGGDGYLHRRLPGGTVVAGVLDITGHGVPAALALSALTARLDTLVSVVTAPDHLLTLLNGQTVRFDPGSTTMATAAVAFLDPDSGAFQVASAGHPPALLARRDGQVEAITQGGLPLGVLDGADYGVSDGLLAPGEAMILYSDGISEADGPAGDRLSWQQLSATLRPPFASAEAAADAVIEAVAGFARGVPPGDDQTIVTIYRREVERG